MGWANKMGDGIGGLIGLGIGVAVISHVMKKDDVKKKIKKKRKLKELKVGSAEWLRQQTQI